MTEPEDFWGDEGFEDTVAAALIACFETKVRKNRGAAPADRLTDERVGVLRQVGPYIASPSRSVLGPAGENLEAGAWKFDVVNDPLPSSGFCAFRPIGRSQSSLPNAYLAGNSVRRVEALGKYWHRRGPGVLYEMISMSAEKDGIHGERRYFTVAKDGGINSCTQAISNGSRGSDFGAAAGVLGPDKGWLAETDAWASFTLQLLADRRFCWSITAKESGAKAHLGCMQEEVKSLLYARSLPMSETGRRRPILHLVEAHKRRLRAGIDIEVSAHLRGVQQVEIGGTLFTVNPPQAIRTTLARQSEQYFAVA